METPQSKSSKRDGKVGCQFCGSDPCICVALQAHGEGTVPPVHEIAEDGAIVQLHPQVIAAACGDFAGPRLVAATASAIWDMMRRHGFSFDEVLDVCAVLMASVLQGAPAPADELVDRVRQKLERVRGKVRLNVASEDIPLREANIDQGNRAAINP